MRKHNQNILSKLFLCFSFLVILPVSSVFSYPVTLQWDSTDSRSEGFEIYVRAEGDDYDYNRPAYRGKGTMCTIEIEDDGLTRYFVARAYAGLDYSRNSNEVYYPLLPFDPFPGDPTSPSDGFNHSDKDMPAVLWPDGDEDVDLSPMLFVNHKENWLPDKILWQISTEKDMSMVVLSITTEGDTFSFEVPEMVLDTDTQYYWQAKFYNSQGGILGLTSIAAFITIEGNKSEDKDSDGIPDDQNLEEESDLDANGVPDKMQSDLLCVKTAKGDGRIGLKNLSPGATLVAVKAVNDINYSNTLNKPEIMTFGLLSFKLFLDEGVEQADVEVFFSEPVAANANWYKFDQNDGWTVFEEASFSEDRTSLTFPVVDGGFGDEDGVKNGIIVDPSGIGIMSQTEDSAAQALNTSNSNSCFIDALDDGEHLTHSALRGCWLLLMTMFFIGVRTLWAQKKNITNKWKMERSPIGI